MGLLGKTKTFNPTPAGIQGLQGEILNYLLGSMQGGTPASNGGMPGTMNSTPGRPGVRSGGVGIGSILNQAKITPYNPDNSFFMNNILGPYQQMFAANRAGALAAAKEQSGNLTGSGFNNIFGSALAGSLANENSQLAQTMMGLRQQDIGQHLAYDQMNQQRLGQNAQSILSLIMGLNPAGYANQQQYQPGFLDYAMKGIAAAAPIAGFMLGGPAGAAVGSAVSNGVGGSLSQGPIVAGTS